MMKVQPLEINESTRVTLHFSLSLEDGQLIDSNFEGAPATFEVGDGNLLPGFERALFGLKPGTRTILKVLPEEGFGEHQQDNIQRLSRTAFDAGMELEEGLIVSFSDQGSGELPGVISRVDSDAVWVDFNHPLAGRVILFEVMILDVTPIATH